MPLPFITSQGIAFALSLGQSQLKKYIQKKIDLKILNQVEIKIENEINLFLKNLQLKTQIYILIAVVNLACLLISFFLNDYRFINYIALFVSVLFILYMTYNSVTNFRRTIDYFQNFESHIKQLLSKELKSAKDADWKNKMALLLDSKEIHDYYLVVLDKMIASLSAWLTRNKSLLYVRIGLFIFASMSLTYSARELLAKL